MIHEELRWAGALARRFGEEPQRRPWWPVLLAALVFLLATALLARAEGGDREEDLPMQLEFRVEVLPFLPAAKAAEAGHLFSVRERLVRHGPGVRPVDLRGVRREVDTRGWIDPTRDHRRLFAALEGKESTNNRWAYNPDEDARGALQERPAYWTDAMRELGLDWPHSCAHDPWAARIAALGYWQHWNATTDEVRARQHNGGGPHGMERRATWYYWLDVKARMECDSENQNAGG